MESTAQKRPSNVSALRRRGRPLSTRGKADRIGEGALELRAALVNIAADLRAAGAALVMIDTGLRDLCGDLEAA